MNRKSLKRLDIELTTFLNEMFDGMGRRERGEAMRAYVSGLLLDGERKSVVPMAARLVDDESEICLLLQAILLRKGVTAVSAHTLAEARTSLRLNTFDGVFLDVNVGSAAFNGGLQNLDEQFHARNLPATG